MEFSFNGINSIGKSIFGGKWTYTEDNQATLIRGARMQVVDWAKQCIDSDNTVYLDTETTGLDMEKDEIVELTIIGHTGHVILFNQWLKPIRPISPEASAVHHITPEDVESKKTIAGWWDEISDMLSGKLIIAYNARFDHQMLRNSSIIHKLRPPEGYVRPSWDCAMMAYSAFRASFKRWKLVDAENLLNEAGMVAHSAIADTTATYMLVKNLSMSNPLIYEYAQNPNVPTPDEKTIARINDAILNDGKLPFEYRYANQRTGFRRTISPTAFFKTLDSSYYVVGVDDNDKTMTEKSYRLELMKIDSNEKKE